MIPSTKAIWYSIAALLLLLLQLNVGLIAVEAVVPELLVILIVIIALVEGHFVAILAGFAIGLAFDFVSSDVIGWNGLAKMVVGFAAGFFYEESTDVAGMIGTPRFLAIVAGTTLLHNVVYYFFYVQPAELSFARIFFRAGLAGMLYTTVVAVIVMLVAARKKSW